LRTTRHRCLRFDEQKIYDTIQKHEIALAKPKSNLDNMKIAADLKLLSDGLADPRNAGKVLSARKKHAKPGQSASSPWEISEQCAQALKSRSDHG
jgi:hypothetical protein